VAVGEAAVRAVVAGVVAEASDAPEVAAALLISDRDPIDATTCRSA
jgi:hypothetical protein